MEELKKWIRSRYAPKVLIISSFEARAIIQKSNLSPAELLQPFTYISHSFTVKTLTSTINCPSVKIDVVDTLECRMNDRILTDNPPQISWDGCYVHGPKDIKQFLSKDSTPWFTAWQQAFLKSLNHSPHELIDMPLAIVYMASTTDLDPLATFQTLSRSQALPQLYHQKIYDGTCPKVFLLFHDMGTSSLKNNEVIQIFEKMQKTLAPSLCHWQCINSAAEPSLNHWGPDKGQIISSSECFQLQMFIDELLMREIVPYIERALKTLDNILEQKRRGLKNSLKGIFGKKNVEFSFQYGGVEHVTRMIADLAFLCGDYDLAVNNYRSACNDFKNYKAWPHAASSSEMQALCVIMLGGDNREVEYALDTAYTLYQRAGEQALLLRCAIITKYVFQGMENYRKLAQKLMNAGNDAREIQVAYPLFMEQTALAYLKIRPAYFRKYAFYQVLAGDEYRKIQLVKHALNCYYSASHIYKDKKYDFVMMHLEHMLGRFCYYLEMYAEAVHFFLSLSSSPKLLIHNDQHQKKIINELISTVAKWTSLPIPQDYDPINKNLIPFHVDGKPLLNFLLPKIKQYSVRLPQDKVVTHGKDNSSGISVTWTSLLSQVSGSSHLTEEFDVFDSNKEIKGIRSFHIGEIVEVSIQTYNPLDLMLIIEDVQVIVEYEDESGVVNMTSLDKLELPPKSEKTVTLEFSPQKPGKLKIRGVKWNYSGVFYGVYHFSELIYEIIPESSSASASFLQFPESLLHGQIQEVQIKVTNQEINAINDLCITFSHPFMFGKSQIKLGDLREGEEKVVDIWMRGEYIGFHTIKFLITYLSQGILRYTRVQSVFEVKPSVKIQTRYESSWKNPNENILQLFVQPAFNAQLSLKQLSSLTNHSLRIIKTLGNEIFYLAVKSGEESQNIIFEQEWLEPVDVKSGFCWEVKESLKKFTNSDPGLDLLISWELIIGQTRIQGHHYLLNLSLFQDKSAIPLRMVIDAPSEISHDFSITPVLLIPVKLSLKSLHEKSQSFNLEAYDSNVQINEKDIQKPPHIWWSGNTCTRFEKMDSGEVKIIEFTALVTEPGCYNLNRFCFTFDSEITKKCVFPYQHQILIN